MQRIICTILSPEIKFQKLSLDEEELSAEGKSAPNNAGANCPKREKDVKYIQNKTLKKSDSSHLLVIQRFLQAYETRFVNCVTGQDTIASDVREEGACGSNASTRSQERSGSEVPEVTCGSARLNCALKLRQYRQQKLGPEEMRQLELTNEETCDTFTADTGDVIPEYACSTCGVCAKQQKKVKH